MKSPVLCAASPLLEDETEVTLFAQKTVTCSLVGFAFMSRIISPGEGAGLDWSHHLCPFLPAIGCRGYPAHQVLTAVLG